MDVKYNIDDFCGFLRSMSMWSKFKPATPDEPDILDTLVSILMKLYDNKPPEDAVHYDVTPFLLMGKKK